MGRRKDSTLYAACQGQDMNAAQQLLDSGLDVNATTQQTKRTALHVAASHVNVQLCNLLLAHGASVLAADSSGRTPAHLAIESQSQQASVLQCLKSMLEATPAEVDDAVKQEWLSSLLRRATEHRSTACARQLLDFGASDPPHGDKGRCCVHVAAGNGELALLEALLSAHPENAGCKDIKGNTPLHVASECGNASAVRSLLAVCSSPRELNSLHQTPLALALSRGHSPVIEAFAEQLLSPSLTAAARTHAHTNIQSPVEHAAPARMSRRATAGRWARMALRDDVQSVQLSAITKDVMASRADPNALIEAAEQGDFVLTQLIIDGGADAASSRRRRRGAVEICLSQMQASRDVRSFQESLIWWTDFVDVSRVNRYSQPDMPQRTCILKRGSHDERKPTDSRDVNHASATCNGADFAGREQQHACHESPETCGQSSCPACWGDAIASAQKKFVLQSLHGRRACLDPVLAALRGREHLLSDLETTVLVLLAHGAPLSVELGEVTALPSAAIAPPCSHPTEPWLGPTAATATVIAAAAASAGAKSSSRSEIKWWLAPEVPVELHGDSRVLVDACACNSWPLVAATLAVTSPDTRLHRDTMPAALDFAVGALNVPVLYELLQYTHRTKQMQCALGQDGAHATNLLLRAVTASVLRKCAPLRLAWSRRTGAAAASSGWPTENTDGSDAQSDVREQAASTDQQLIDCIQAAVPSEPILPLSMRYVHAVAVSEAADNGLRSGDGKECCVASAVPDVPYNLDGSATESMRTYMHPVDETMYANTLSTRVQDIHFVGGGQGITVVSRTLESLGGTPLQAQWQCAATMHIVDAFVSQIIDSTSTLSSACSLPDSCTGAYPESAEDAVSGMCPVDWDAVLFVLGKMWAFPRALKPVVDQILRLRHYWHLNAVKHPSHSRNQGLSTQGQAPEIAGFGKGLQIIYHLSNAATATATGGCGTHLRHHGFETIPFYIVASTIRAGNLFMLQRLWQYPLESVHGGTGVTLLHVAAHCNAPVIARFLIHNNVPHLATDSDGRNALHHVFLSNTNPSATLSRAWQVRISVADACMPPSTGSLTSPDPPVDVHRALSPFSRPPGTAPGRMQQTDTHAWLGEAQASATSGTTQSDCDLHNCLRCLRGLVLLEDCGGLAPIDLCPSCGRRYRRSLGMLASDSTEENADNAAMHGTQVGVTQVGVHLVTGTATRTEIGSESVHKGSNGRKPEHDCRCGGIVWRCALEQSLKICALLVPDVLLARGNADSVVGGPKYAPEESNLHFSDLPKEVRVMICQRSCIFRSSSM